jgi:hypothetical protein
MRFTEFAELLNVIQVGSSLDIKAFTETRNRASYYANQEMVSGPPYSGSYNEPDGTIKRWQQDRKFLCIRTTCPPS